MLLALFLSLVLQQYFYYNLSRFGELSDPFTEYSIVEISSIWSSKTFPIIAVPAATPSPPKIAAYDNGSKIFVGLIWNFWHNFKAKGIKIATNLEANATSLKGELDVQHQNYNYTGNDLNYFVSSAQNDKPDSGYKNNIYSSGIGLRFEQFKDIYL